MTLSIKYGAYTVKHSRIGAIWLLMLMSCQYQHLYQMAMKFSYHSGNSIFANSKLLKLFSFRKLSTSTE
jgi:hypothetical protein